MLQRRKQEDADDLIVRSQDIYDNATPSGNSSAVKLFYKLGKIFQKEEYLIVSRTILESVAESCMKYPMGFGNYLSGMLYFIVPSSEIIICEGENPSELKEMLQTIWNYQHPNRIILYDNNELSQKNLSYLEGKSRVKNLNTIFICENFACKAPITSLSELKETLI